jgi:hypothetical protein
VVIAHSAGTTSEAFLLVGFAVCFAIRMVGLRFNIQLPVSPSGRHAKSGDAEGTRNTADQSEDPNPN